MFRFPATLAEIGDFVLAVALAPQNFHRGKVHIRLHIIVRQIEFALMLAQGRTLFQFQAVATDVLRFQFQHVQKRLLPGFQILLRQTVDQIQREIFEAGLADHFHRVHSHCIVVGAADGFQNSIVAALHAQADPVKAFAVQPTQKLGVDGIGVGLKGDLRVAGHVKGAADGGQNSGHALCTEKAGGAAAEIDGVHPVAGGQGAGLPDVIANGIQIAVMELGVQLCHGVKVAVMALTATKGNMDVDPKGCFLLGGE